MVIHGRSNKCRQSEPIFLNLKESKMKVTETQEEKITKSTERRTFFITTFLFMPMISASIVGAFGFILWFSQSLFS